MAKTSLFSAENHSVAASQLGRRCSSQTMSGCQFRCRILLIVSSPRHLFIWILFCSIQNRRRPGAVDMLLKQYRKNSGSICRSNRPRFLRRYPRDTTRLAPGREKALSRNIGRRLRSKRRHIIADCGPLQPTAPACLIMMGWNFSSPLPLGLIRVHRRSSTHRRSPNPSHHRQVIRHGFLLVFTAPLTGAEKRMSPDGENLSRLGPAG